jgi:hypothetical protein
MAANYLYLNKYSYIVNCKGGTYEEENILYSNMYADVRYCVYSNWDKKQ